MMFLQCSEWTRQYYNEPPNGQHHLLARVWEDPLDHPRIPSQQSAGETAAEQLTALVPELPVRPLLVGDRYYGRARFVGRTAQVACDKLLRVPGNRVFYRPAPRKTGRRGAPKKDGPAFKCRDKRTQGKPTMTWSGRDEHHQRIEVAAWAGLHDKQCRSVAITGIRVMRQGATHQKRDPRVSWFIWVGADPSALQDVWPTYRRRYGQEHGFRFEKQDLLWLEPRFRTPEQFQRWTDIMAAAQNQVVLARPLAEACRYPWEAHDRATPPRDGANSGAVGDARPAAPTPWKIAGAKTGHTGHTGTTLSDDLQKHDEPAVCKHSRRRTAQPAQFLRF